MNEDAYDAALRIILRRPHSEGELIEKLKRKDFDTDEIAATLGQLRAEKHLDDARLAREFVVYHLEYKPMGRRGIAQRMMLKRFKQADIDSALSEVSVEQERAAAERLLESRLNRESLKRLSEQERRDRLARFLLSRGFDQGLVLEVLAQPSHRDS